MAVEGVSGCRTGVDHTDDLTKGVFLSRCIRNSGRNVMEITHVSS